MRVAGPLRRSTVDGVALECGQRNSEVRTRHATGACPRNAGAAGRGASVLGRGPDGARDADWRGAARMLDVTYGPLPAMRVEMRGYGAGGRDTPGEPNLLRLLVGEETATAGAEPARLAPESTEPIAVPIAVMETVIDDANPQLLAYVSELLLEAGAWDVYRTAVQMKKGRTGMQVTVLSSPERVPALREILFRETTTIGLRWRIENKIALAREFADVETEWGNVRMKIARLASGEVANASPEYEDCRAIARQHGAPLKRVMQAATRGVRRIDCGCEESGRLMDPAQIEALLNEVREGKTGVEEALTRLRHLPFEDMGFAKLDHHRALRTGNPEVIFRRANACARGCNISTNGSGGWQRTGHARVEGCLRSRNCGRAARRVPRDWRAPSR